MHVLVFSNRARALYRHAKVGKADIVTDLKSLLQPSPTRAGKRRKTDPDALGDAPAEGDDEDGEAWEDCHLACVCSSCCKFALAH